MAFTKQAELKGFDRHFQVSPEARPYTLRDNGFVNTRPGNFEYKRELDTDFKQGVVVKVKVNKDMDKLSISTVNSRGIQAIDVSKLENNDMLVEKINFIFDGFVDRNCLIEIKD